jgi:hypothetical protein
MQMKQTKIILPARTGPQKRIDSSTKRFNVAVWGRQSGKTTQGLFKMVKRPLMARPDGTYWFILQTYSAAKVAFRRFKKLTDPFTIDKSESELVVTLRGNRSIFFKSGRNFEDLRAETLDGVIIDEYRQQHPDLWSMVIRPMLSRRKGWCDFLSTTNGFDHFKDLYDAALLNPNEWATFQAPSTEAPWWTEEEIASARSAMSEDVFAQEILAEFREIGAGKTYKNHGVQNQLVANPFAVRGYEWSHYLPIIVGLDFNVGLCVWMLGQIRADEFYYGDEIALEDTDSEQMAKVLAEKVKNHKPGVILVGDASGNARKSSAAGQTDYSIVKRVLKENNIHFEDRTPTENPGVKDRVNCVNSLLKAADGSVRLWYNPSKCKYLKRDFERVKWKKGADGAFLDKTDPLATHASDAAGYPISVFSNVFRERPGRMRVIVR